MCIRDRLSAIKVWEDFGSAEASSLISTWAEVLVPPAFAGTCLLYTSDAADERSSVDLGGRRIIKKKNNLDVS